MLGPVIRSELVRHLRSHRLLALFLGGPALFVAATLVHLGEVRDHRLVWSQLSQEAEQSASLMEVVVPRPMPELGFLRAAAREQWREGAVVQPHLVDVAQTDMAERSYLFAAEPLDWTAVVLFFYSLMAVAFSYDAVAGEKASGTLRLLASRPIGRLPLILSKVLACFLVVSAALVLGVLVGLVVVVAAGEQDLRLAQGGLLTLAVVQMLVFLLVNVLLGIAASVSTVAPDSALQRALGAWTLLALVLPGLIVVMGTAQVPTQSELEFQRNAAIHDLSFNSRLSVSSMQLVDIVRVPDLSPTEKRRRIADLEAGMWADQELALSQREEGYAELRREYLRHLANQEAWVDRWSALSPHTLLRMSMNRLAMAGSAGRREFHRQLALFEPVFTAYAQEQRALRRDEALEGVAKAIQRDPDEGVVYELRALTRLDWSGLKVPRASLPRFNWLPPTADGLLGPTLRDVFWMLLFAAALGAFVILRFAKYDCR